MLFGQKLFYSGKSGCNLAKWLYSGISGCIRAKWFSYAQKWFYLGKNCFIQTKIVVFGQGFVFGQSGCIPGKVVVFGRK